jgi:hypothetical protein
MRALPAPILVVASALAAAVPARGAPVITEVAWMGSDASANDEWIEIYNPGPGAIEASDFVLIQGATVRPLPSAPLAEGAFLILERTDVATPLEPPDALLFGFGAGLTNGGQILCLCGAGGATCDGACDIVNPTGATWFAGSNTVPKKTMERKDPALDGSLASSWQNGSPSSPGDHAPLAPVDAGPEPGSDAGPVDSGPPPVDAGPNTAPTVSVSQPAGTATGAVVPIVYSAADPDEGDAVSVDLYWSFDGQGEGGVRFARGLPGGTNVNAELVTSGLPAGTLQVFALARDTRGAVSLAYAPGVVAVQGGGASDEARLVLKDPDGVNDIDRDNGAIVSWEVELPPGGTGSVSLFLDDDDGGEGGVAVAGGLSAGPEGPRAFRVPLEGLEPGERFVYGVLDYTSPAGAGRIVSYAPASLFVGDSGCACTDKGKGGPPRLLAVATLAILLLPFFRSPPFRRRKA